VRLNEEAEMKTRYSWGEIEEVLDLLFPDDENEGWAWLWSHFDLIDGYWHLRFSLLPPEMELVKLRQEGPPCAEP
jgi:hypothetical protein